MALYRNGGKRVLDVILASGALVALSPVLAGIVAAIRLDDGAPILYRQERIGNDGHPFTLLKFRSMPIDSASTESADAESLETTRIGTIIRRLSLDELPQLVNIVQGDMSIVGPRPPLPTQVDLIELRRANGAIDLRPGLTGLAQIKAYDNMPTDEKARWDGVYAQTVSFLTDVSIIARTIGYLAKPPPTY